MENPIVVPFDLNTARKIKSGEIEGSVLINNIEIEFVYEFIAGGCFKNILFGERVKDIDIFFESESDFQEAVDLFNDKKTPKRRMEI